MSQDSIPRFTPPPWSSSSSSGSIPTVSSGNQSLLHRPLVMDQVCYSCVLCHGYLINATRILQCGHVFCRSCLLNAWKSEPELVVSCPIPTTSLPLDTTLPPTRPTSILILKCPQCCTDLQISTPLNESQKSTENLLDQSPSIFLADNFLQRIVYLNFPHLFHNEVSSRRNFHWQCIDSSRTGVPSWWIADSELLSVSVEVHCYQPHQGVLSEAFCACSPWNSCSVNNHIIQARLLKTTKLFFSVQRHCTVHTIAKVVLSKLEVSPTLFHLKCYLEPPPVEIRPSSALSLKQDPHSQNFSHMADFPWLWQGILSPHFQIGDIAYASEWRKQEALGFRMELTRRTEPHHLCQCVQFNMALDKMLQATGADIHLNGAAKPVSKVEPLPVLQEDLEEEANIENMPTHDEFNTSKEHNTHGGNLFTEHRLNPAADSNGKWDKTVMPPESIRRSSSPRESSVTPGGDEEEHRMFTESSSPSPEIGALVVCTKMLPGLDPLFEVERCASGDSVRCTGGTPVSRDYSSEPGPISTNTVMKSNTYSIASLLDGDEWQDAE